ncbi:GNAT family N-acetyltransferase [Tumebacillus lipolyticus]|uniref:GNAT family N-acetyltransferase n=1 Tax=Tumebacillus lipolyticus TaxID=1280370 RepID=A0ABW5A293_9BACL
MKPLLTDEVQLRDMTVDDLPIFFEYQLDREANRMAAFTAKDPEDREAFMQHWNKVMGNEANIKKTVLFEGQVAGNVLQFEFFGHQTVAYWLGKQYWGKGIATRALSEFIHQVGTRPLYARVAKDNIGSFRVLEKCGFLICGEDKGYANARGEEIEEYILRLEVASIE